MSDPVSPVDWSAAPYPPTLEEAKFFYYGLPSQPRLVARSSTFIYVEQTGLEAYHNPKETSPFNSSHPLSAIWEATVGPAMVDYLDTKRVKWTSLDPVHMGYIGESSPLPIVWLGVIPGCLSATEGVEVATHCRGILSAHNVDDVHVEIRESEVVLSAGHSPKLYRPAPASSPIARAREPFSTALGLPICTEKTPSVEGTGGFFFSDPRKPGKLYLVTVRHVLFPPAEDANEPYSGCDAGEPCRNVLLFGNAALEKHLEAIRAEISGKESTIDWLERRLAAAKELDEEDAEMERAHAQRELNPAQEALADLKALLADISSDWTRCEGRVLGHVVLSPPLGVDPGSGFAEDWAVVEVEVGAKVDATNFVGNAVDLATSGNVSIVDFTTWMCPQWQPGLSAGPQPGPFRYPRNRLLKFHGTIPDEEVWKPHLQSPDHNNDNDNHGEPQCIMVIKRGSASGLTVGRLNTLRSFTRIGDWQTSKAITVLPRSSKWPRENPFAQPGDSGAGVIDGRGRLAGLLVGGTGKPGEDTFDCTYLTSIDFLRRRMAEYGVEADLSPSFAQA
ncbi:hypothetical protein V8D89_003144 [Ganoderma adspersum]